MAGRRGSRAGASGGPRRPMTTIAETTSTTAEPSPAEPSTWNRLKSGFSRHRISLLGLAEHAMLAGLAYIPLVLVKAGVVTSDTKTYLYLDPGRFLRQATSMWDPTVGLGTVTHQYIGYLLPMGPFYWFFSVIGVPVWVAQRLWLGSILFAAGAGVLYLSRTLQLRAPARTVAALAFMLSPYLLQYSGRISVILLPWAGLPFMVALTAKALRDGGWRYPALFAIVVALTSGINATAILYVGVAPILWLVFAVSVQREVTLKTGIVVAARLALLTILACLWWITGLIVEAAYGVDVLRYTETLRATTSTSSASDVIRGLGYWYFYGQDRLGAWTASVLLYTQHLWLVALSYLVPVLSFLGGVIARWRHRTYFVVLVLVGVVLSVGSHPFSNPTPVGSLLKKFMVDTTAGLALRSTDRATPLVILGLAMLLGSGVSALRRRLPRTSLVIALAVVTAVIADNPAIFNGDAEVASFFVQPAKLPSLSDEGDHAPEHHPPGHPGPRHPRRAVRVVPVRRHRRPPAAGIPHPPIRDPRAAGHGLDRDRRHARRPRRPDRAGHRAVVVARPDGPAAQRRRRPRPVRPALRALQLARAPAARPRPGQDARRAERPGQLRHAPTQHAELLLRRRPEPGPDHPAPQPPATGRLHRRQPPPGHPGRVERGGADRGGRRGRAGGPRRRGPAQHRQRHLLREHPRQGPGPAGRTARRRRRGGAHRHQPQAGVPLEHLRRGLRLHRDPGRQPGPERPVGFPPRSHPSGPDRLEDGRRLPRRARRDRVLVRERRLLCARDLRLRGDRQQPRHQLDDRDRDTRPGRAVVAAPAGPGDHDRPSHTRPAPERQHQPDHHPRHPHLRRRPTGDRAARRGVADRRRPEDPLRTAQLPDPADHDRRHERRHRLGGGGHRGRLRRGRAARRARLPDREDADRPAEGRRGRVGARPAHHRHVPRAGVAVLVPLPHRPGDHHRPGVHAADRPHLHPHRYGQPLGAHSRRRDRPAGRAGGARADQRRGRLFEGAPPR